MTDVETDTLIGQTVAGHYEVLSCLDPAGNTEVFKVKDNRDAVIKVLKIIRSFREDKLDQFLIEAERIKTQVKHPSLAQLQDFGVIREQEKLGTFVYMIYDFLSGRSLYSVLNRQGRIELSEALPIFIQVCDLAKHLQAVGVNNLSLSPRKIMVSDSVQAAKLNETGLSSTLTTLNLDPADTSSAFPEGVLYLSPEQCSQQSTDFRSDVYSLGCIMYECLVGLPPFLSKSPYEVSRMHINEEVKPLRMSRDDLSTRA